MQVKNLKYNATGTVDCEIEHPQYGWIPFTASPDDSEQFGRNVYAQAMSGTLGVIAAYVPPQKTPEEVKAEAAAKRQRAYEQEADPLFFKAQRGETTMDEWRAKVAEIKVRFPG